ncbi:MAG: radical SAM protein [Promethearchaeota archaeon]
MLPGKLRIREVSAKSVLNPSRIGGVDYAINPFVGCQHGCSYCYARFMQRYTGHSGEDWGQFVDIKVNAAHVLQQQLRRRQKPVTEAVLFSSVTDAYQPLERRFQVTRNCLNILRRHNVPVSILTKSDLVLRDIDLLRELSDCEVGMTVITLEERVRRVFESGAPSAERRLTALKELSEGGIRTFGFVGPIIPYLCKPSLEELVRRLAEGGVAHVFFDRLNLKYGNWPVIERVLQTYFVKQYKAICNALKPSSCYYEELRDEVVSLAHRYGLEADILF